MCSYDKMFSDLWSSNYEEAFQNQLREQGPHGLGIPSYMADGGIRFGQSYSGITGGRCTDPEVLTIPASMPSNTYSDCPAAPLTIIYAVPAAPEGVRWTRKRVAEPLVPDAGPGRITKRVRTSMTSGAGTRAKPTRPTMRAAGKAQKTQTTESASNDQSGMTTLVGEQSDVVHGSAFWAGPMARKCRGRTQATASAATEAATRPRKQGTDTIPCSVGCGKVFTREYDMKRHVQAKHPESLPPHLSKMPYTCDSCLYGFSRRDTWVRHNKSQEHLLTIERGKPSEFRVGRPPNAILMAEDEDEVSYTS